MKRNIRKRKNRKEICALCIGACLCAFLLTGCGKEEADTENDFSVILSTGPEDSDVYIEAIPDISDDFIRGMDASSVLVEENSGVVYYNFDGEEQDVFRTLAESGVNYIRFRVWNDPYDENGNGYGGGNYKIRSHRNAGCRCGCGNGADWK